MIRPANVNASLAVVAVLVLAAATPMFAGPAPGSAVPSVGRVEIHHVHGSSLEQTVTGESADRAVAVYLPPGYSDTDRRFPALYLLHGIGDTEEVWTRSWGGPEDGWRTIEQVMNRGIAEGRLDELVVVMPDLRTIAGGSFYVNSTVSGRWEDFVVDDLVPWVDASFRTVARAEGRGIAGHSMGGYGAITLGMRHPDVWSVVYAMSPALLGWGGELTADNPVFRSLLQRAGWDDLEGFYERGIICVAQAFSPNPDRPPFYVDLPFALDGSGDLVASEPAHRAWLDHFPVETAPRYRDKLMTLRGLRFDAGWDDEFRHIPATSRRLSAVLAELEVPHGYEEYNGGHRNRFWGRTGRLSTEVLPWFSMLLEGAAGDRSGAENRPPQPPLAAVPGLGKLGSHFTASSFQDP